MQVCFFVVTEETRREHAGADYNPQCPSPARTLCWDSGTCCTCVAAAMMTAWQAKDPEQRKELAHDALSISVRYAVSAPHIWNGNAIKLVQCAVGHVGCACVMSLHRKHAACHTAVLGRISSWPRRRRPTLRML